MKRILLAILLLLSVQSVFSQTKLKEKAQKYYKISDYAKTTMVLDKAKEFDTEMLRMQADSYFKLGDYENAEKYFEQLSNAPDKTADDLYGYIQVLIINGKYSEAMKQVSALRKLAPDDLRGKLLAQDTSYYEKLLKNHPVNVTNLSFNTDADDFAAVLINDTLVFTSSRFIGKASVILDNASDLQLFNILTAKYNAENGNVKDIKPMKMNSQLNEGVATFSADGKKMIYSANYPQPDENGAYRLQLLEAEFVNGKWTNIKALNINNKEYSVSQPFLCADGKTLYFVSDMPGGFGGMDIYVSHLQKNGEWGMPENLGGNVNTESNEAFPYVKNGFLYFASDGRPGLGGMDVFAAKIKDGKVLYSVNLGSPVNSNYDDFALYLTDDKNGFLSSNRPSGKGYDDIYSVEFQDIYFDKALIKVAVENPAGEKIDDAVVVATINGKDQNLKLVDGKTEIFADKNSKVEISAEKDGYLTSKQSVNTAGNDEFDLKITLNPDIKIAGIVKDAENSSNLEGVKVVLENSKGERKEAVTDGNGKFSIPVEDLKASPFKLTFTKDGYKNDQKQFDIPLTQIDDYNVSLTLTKGIGGSNLPQELLVYFDFNKANLTNSAKNKLDGFIALVPDNKSVAVELSGYADSKGTDAFNQKLSERRAKNVYKYLNKKLKNKDVEITYKAYGESKPFVVTKEVHEKYPFLPEGQALTDDFISSLSQQQQEIADMLNRRVEIIIKNKE